MSKINRYRNKIFVRHNAVITSIGGKITHIGQPPNSIHQDYVRQVFQTQCFKLHYTAARLSVVIPPH
jgi:hypothetical protein